MDLLSYERTFFTVLGYPMSYIEFFGTVLNLVSVWLVTRQNILTWPIGNVAAILLGILFWQIQLYSDLLEQCYFLLAGFYGWWAWARLQASELPDNAPLPIKVAGPREMTWYALAIVFGTATLSFVMANVHLWFPHAFPQKAEYVIPDAFTTILSFAATLLMAHKRLQCWYLWITVDVIAIWLYWVKGFKFLSIEYAIFLGLATWGLISWNRMMRARQPLPFAA